MTDRIHDSQNRSCSTLRGHKCMLYNGSTLYIITLLGLLPESLLAGYAQRKVRSYPETVEAVNAVAYRLSSHLERGEYVSVVNESGSLNLAVNQRVVQRDDVWSDEWEVVVQGHT